MGTCRRGTYQVIPHNDMRALTEISWYRYTAVYREAIIYCRQVLEVSKDGKKDKS